MIKTMCRAVLLCLLLALVPLAGAGAANIGAAEVTADLLNFRDAPDADTGQILDAAPCGTVVLILEEEDGWARVLWDGREGYMSLRYLSAVDEAAMELGTGVLTGDGVRFRSAASLDSPVLRYLFRGDTVTVKGVSGPWYRVEYAGSTGYLHSDYVALAANSPGEDGALGQVLVDTALEYLDIPYQWGGTGPEEGFDCSGLVYYCYAQHGRSINRTASTQYKQGQSVERAELQPGDLVFFAGTDSWSISHVGIYMGDDSFIHASSGSGKVIVSDLTSWYYDTYYYGARRLS